MPSQAVSFTPHSCSCTQARLFPVWLGDPWRGGWADMSSEGFTRGPCLVAVGTVLVGWHLLLVSQHRHCPAVPSSGRFLHCPLHHLLWQMLCVPLPAQGLVQSLWGRLGEEAALRAHQAESREGSGKEQELGRPWRRVEGQSWSKGRQWGQHRVQEELG